MLPERAKHIPQNMSLNMDSFGRSFCFSAYVKGVYPVGWREVLPARTVEEILHSQKFAAQ